MQCFPLKACKCNVALYFKFGSWLPNNHVVQLQLIHITFSLALYLFCLQTVFTKLYDTDGSVLPCNYQLSKNIVHEIKFGNTGPRSAVGNVSGYRCMSDCRSRGREFDPGPVPYFRGDWSWNNFYGHSPPFRWFIQEGLLSVTSESMCTNYWLTACSSLPRKKCG